MVTLQNTAPRLARLQAALHIHPGEGRLVALLVALYFALAGAFVFVQSMAFGVFLTEFGPQGLPYSYVAIAILASLVAILYLKLSERVSFPALLTINLSCLGAGCVVFWLGLTSGAAREFAFFLPLWFQIVINLGNLAVWPLAGRLFDVRQGKRLFGLVGAGNWLANVLGGFLVPPLVAWLGTTNLLLLAAGSLAVALIILRVIVGSYLGPPAPSAQHRAPTRKPKAGPSLLRNRYVVLIFGYTLLWWVTFFFADNIFFDRAAAQYPDAAQLTSFIGRLLSATGVIALITTTFLTHRILGRYGLWAGLLAEPVVVTVGIAALAISGSAGGAVALLFWWATLSKLTSVALGFSLSQSATLVAYQPLTGDQRGRVQTLAEGIVQPLAIGLAGLMLLLLNNLLGLKAVGLAFVFLVIAIPWIIVIILLVRQYPAALAQAIAKRRWGETSLSLLDQASLDILQRGLRDPHPGAAIYALNALERIEHPSLATALPELLEHPAPEVRREALQRIERRGLTSAAEAVSQRLDVEQVPEVKEAALRALAATGESGAFNQVVAALDDSDFHAQRGALVGLLRHGGIDGVLAAGQVFNHLVNSPTPAERALAAQVLGEVGVTHFYQPAWALLHDADPGVRRAALNAAGKIKHPKLWPAVVEACASHEVGRAAGLALAAGGEAAIPEIETAFARAADQPRVRLVTLARACSRIRGERVISLLQNNIDFPDGEVRTQILSALSACGYRAADQARVRKQIQAELAQAAWTAAALVELGEDEEAALLAAALNGSLRQTRDRLLFLLSFLFAPQPILRAREALAAGLAVQQAYALEIIDTQLPADMKAGVLPLCEDLPPASRLARLSVAFPQPKLNREERLNAIIAGPEAAMFSAWARACALYIASDPKGNSAMLSTIEKVIILKTVSVFGETPDDVLAEVAELLEEVETAEGETVFNKGDLGDSLYVIVDGKVRVHDGDRLLNYLGERDVFGEMALLDPEPRLASVTTVEPTRFFRLARAPFYELMADRPEVATGIIRVLTGHLRARVRDLANLDARLKELEQTKTT